LHCVFCGIFFLLFYAVAEPTIYVFIFGWGVGGSKIMMIKICVLHNVFNKSNSNNMQIKAIFFFLIKDKSEKKNFDNLAMFLD
jgi:hypothetical protein